MKTCMYNKIQYKGDLGCTLKSLCYNLRQNKRLLKFSSCVRISSKLCPVCITPLQICTNLFKRSSQRRTADIYFLSCPAKTSFLRLQDSLLMSTVIFIPIQTVFIRRTSTSMSLPHNSTPS